MDLIYPQMVTSTDNNTLFGEPIRDSLNKYNNHNHARGQILNFLAAGVCLGDTVESAYILTDSNGTNVSLFNVPATVQGFSEDLKSITVSEVATTTSNNFILKIIRDTETFYISNCSSTQNSNIITLNNSIPGFIEPTILDTLATCNFTFTFNNIANNVLYPVIKDSPFTFYLENLKTYTVIDIYDSDYSSAVDGTVSYHIGAINNSAISANTSISVNDAALNLSVIDKTTSGYCFKGDNLCLVFSGIDTSVFNNTSSASILVSLTLKKVIPCYSHHYELITL